MITATLSDDFTKIKDEKCRYAGTHITKSCIGCNPGHYESCERYDPIAVRVPIVPTGLQRFLMRHGADYATTAISLKNFKESM